MSRRAIGITLAVVVLAAAGWWAFSPASGVPVTIAPVERVSSLQSLVTASGEIVASRYAEIGANVMGRLVSLTVKEGDTVTAGQVLARIDPVQASSSADAADASLAAILSEARAAETRERAAQAALQEARARAEESESALARSRQLRDAGLLPAAEFDRVVASAAAAASQVASAAAAVEQARHAAEAAGQRGTQGRAERARARDQLSKTAITAPIDGVITRLDVEVGEMVVIGVQNQPGTILMIISDLSSINAEVKVAEADVMRLAQRMPATVTLEAVPNQRFPGRIIDIGASALPQIGAQAAAREFRIKVQLDRTNTPLRPGLTCDAEIVAAERRNVLAVPLQAVVERNGRSGVFTVESGVARFVPVTSGIIGGLMIEVDGLTEGATIISGPIQTLRTLEAGTAVTTAGSDR
jgi:HlyD family secretion protein